MSEKIGKYLDLTGAAASWLCAVHCLALPFLITFLPLAGLSFLLDEKAEKIFIAVSAALAAVSLLPGFFREHRRLYPFLTAAAGIAMVLLTHLFFEDYPAAKFTFLLAGALFISGGHLLNRRLCRRCSICGAAGDQAAH